jgi:hypothetical protein
MRPLAVCAGYSKATGVDWMRNVTCRAINSAVGGSRVQLIVRVRWVDALGQQV